MGIPQHTSFVVGRQSEVQRLDELLAGRTSYWLLNIYGPGGIGKTVVGHTFAAYHAPAEETVLEGLGRLETWKLVTSLTKTEAERVALYERFVLDLPPRVIQSRHPTLFPEVTVVYATLRNLCERLRKYRPLVEHYAELQTK